MLHSIYYIYRSILDQRVIVSHRCILFVQLKSQNQTFHFVILLPYIAS